MNRLRANKAFNICVSVFSDSQIWNLRQKVNIPIWFPCPTSDTFHMEIRLAVSVVLVKPCICMHQYDVLILRGQFVKTYINSSQNTFFLNAGPTKKRMHCIIQCMIYTIKKKKVNRLKYFDQTFKKECVLIIW